MDGDPAERVRALFRRARRLERRELREFRAWLETTRNLIHLTVLVVVPALIALVTVVSNLIEAVSFLLYPPLAAGTYTLFSDPSGEYASPLRFVAGLTAGAVCGAVALRIAAAVGAVATVGVSPVGAATAVFLTGAVTWGFDVEEPAAFSAALLALVTQSGGAEYVVSIAVSSVLVAGAFVAWKGAFYEERARYLYQSTKGDDRVLVPMRGPRPGATAMLAGRLAAAHEAGKVVLLALVDEGDVETAREAVEAVDRAPLEGRAVGDDGGGQDRDAAPGADGAGAGTVSGGEGDDEAEQRAAAALATDLEARAGVIEDEVGVPCQVVVAATGDEATTVVRVAHETNCDLVATPWQADGDGLAPYVRRLFDGDVDVLVHRSADGRTEWGRVLVPVRRASDIAHEMIDFAARLVGDRSVTLLHCIDSERDRRRAESMLADLAETVAARVETVVARDRVEAYLATRGERFDLVILGASQERSRASRFVSRPTFQRIEDVGTDVAVLDRNFRP